ncbi:MAG: EboA domain-containing protein [Bacteroidota bacterium]|nr:EboA domain-containing protein [Bacteroidota bacterium]
MPALSWVNKSIEKINSNDDDKDLFTCFSMASRWTGKDRLNIDTAELEQAKSIKEGFNPLHFSADQATRILLLLSSYKNDNEKFAKKLDKILSVADIPEKVAIYSSLPFLPDPDKFSGLAADGLRTNITEVFDSIVLNNPYPMEYLPENAWNQMVLKAIFTNRPLYKIYGFDKRKNKALANMLSDFAHERWAAGRGITPELWRATGPFLDEYLFTDIEKIIASENIYETEAACLACTESHFDETHKLLAKYPGIREDIARGKLNWDILGKKLELV